MQIEQAHKVVQDHTNLIKALEEIMIEKAIKMMGERRRSEILGLDRISITKDGGLQGVVAWGWNGDPDYELVPITAEDLEGVTL